MPKLPPAQSFEDLIVWQKSHRLTLFVYQVTAAFPKTELYGLVSQMRRAAVSVPANIAEGFKRRKNPDKARCMNIAQSSLEEVRYYFLLARDLGYLEKIERERRRRRQTVERLCAVGHEVRVVILPTSYLPPPTS